jgi:hypothetical protein
LGGEIGSTETVVPLAVVEQLKVMGYRLVSGADNNWAQLRFANVRRVSEAEITTMDEHLAMPRCVAEEAWDHVGIARFLGSMGKRSFQQVIERGLDRHEKYQSPDGRQTFSVEQFLGGWREDRQNQTRLERLRLLNGMLRSKDQVDRDNWDYLPPKDISLPLWLPKQYWGAQHPMVMKVQGHSCYFHIYKMEKIPGVRLVLGVAAHLSNQQLLVLAKEVFGARDDLGISRASDDLWAKGLGYLVALEIMQNGTVLRPEVSDSIYETAVLSPFYSFIDFERAPRLLVDKVLVEELLKVYDDGSVKFDAEQLPYQFGTVVIGQQGIKWLASDKAGVQPLVRFDGPQPGKEQLDWYMKGVVALFRALTQPNKLIVLKPDPLPQKKSTLKKIKNEGREHLRPLRALLWLDGQTYRPLEIFKPQKPSELTGKKRDAHFVRGHFWLCPYGPRRSQRELRWRKFHVRGVGNEKGHDVAIKKVNVEDIPGVAYMENKT